MPARRYQLLVEGELDGELDLLLEGIAFSSAPGTTTLTASVRDQAELQALLQRLSTLGLTLLEVTIVDDAGQPVGLEEQIRQERRARRRSLRRPRKGPRSQVDQSPATTDIDVPPDAPR